MSFNANPKEPSDISLKSAAKIILLFAGFALLLKLSTLILLLFLGGMLSVVLDSFCRKLERLKVPRKYAIAGIAVALFGTFLCIAFLLIPAVSNQVVAFVGYLPQVRSDLLNRIPDQLEFKSFVEDLLNSPKLPDNAVIMNQALSFISGAAEVIVEFFLVWIFSIYLLVDGKRALTWIADFFAAPVRLKLNATADETSDVISAYATAQFIASIGSGLFCFLVLSFFHIPGALTLATFAGIFDVIPIIGFFVSLIPAALMGFSVSSGTGLSIIALYVGYHVLESYLIMPLIYRSRMKISGLVVMLALLAAGSVGGVLLALAILPIVASYPIIERLWLVKFLGRDVIDRHAHASSERALPDQVKVWDQSLTELHRSTTLNNKDLSKHFKRRILIVEDDPDIRSTLQDILETEGYHPYIASNGNEALMTLERVPGIGLVLMDINMPSMGGREVFEIMKKMPQFASIPVVFLSASINGETIPGAAGMLRKPSPLEDVIAAVEKNYLRSTSASLF